MICAYILKKTPVKKNMHDSRFNVQSYEVSRFPTLDVWGGCSPGTQSQNMYSLAIQIRSREQANGLVLVGT